MSVIDGSAGLMASSSPSRNVSPREGEFSLADSRRSTAHSHKSEIINLEIMVDGQRLTVDCPRG